MLAQIVNREPVDISDARSGWKSQRIGQRPDFQSLTAQIGTRQVLGGALQVP